MAFSFMYLASLFFGVTKSLFNFDDYNFPCYTCNGFLETFFVSSSFSSFLIFSLLYIKYFKFYTLFSKFSTCYFHSSFQIDTKKFLSHICIFFSSWHLPNVIFILAVLPSNSSSWYPWQTWQWSKNWTVLESDD